MNRTGLFWIASYPKSGNTWVRCLIASLSQGGATPDINALYKRCPFSAHRNWLEEVTQIPVSDLTLAELKTLRAYAHCALAADDPISRLVAPEVRCIKVHDQYEPAQFPPSATAGAVYIVRDPRGVAPSWADQTNQSLDAAIKNMGRSGFTFSDSTATLARVVDGPLGSWSEHVASWLDRFSGPLLLLRYEDLLARTAEEVTRLAHFLDLPTDRDIVAAAIKACNFSALQAAEAHSGFVDRGYQELFFRRGQSEGWRDELSPAQAVVLIECHGTLMRRLGYDTEPCGGGHAIA